MGLKDLGLVISFFQVLGMKTTLALLHALGLRWTRIMRHGLIGGWGRFRCWGGCPLLLYCLWA